MEHLGDVLTPALGFNRIPLWFNKERLQVDRRHVSWNTNFHTFVNGKHGFRIEGDETPVRVRQDTFQELIQDDYNEELTAFVQRWLFFELLLTVLGYLPGFDINHFIRSEEEETAPLIFVTTQELRRYLDGWLDFELQNPEGSRYRILRAQFALDKARHYVLNKCSVRSADENSEWPIDPKVAFSLMVLGETLTTHLIRVQQETGFEMSGWCNHDHKIQGWGYSQAVLVKLKKETWCPKQVAMFQVLLGENTIGLLYALRLKPSGKAVDHSLCTSRQCRAVGSSLNDLDDPFVPDPAHCEQYCKSATCKAVGPDMQRVKSIINSGNVPLFRYTAGKDEVMVEEMSAACKKKYVVFSHVWADGYGNPKWNKLNKCVLMLFLRLFKDVRFRNATPEQRGNFEGSESFWIDTLAIPVGKESKEERKKAIRRMHNIYKGAKYTIVLDSTIMSMERQTGYVHSAMAITLSGWMTRLWTLQEAMLSKQLYFNFSDQIYPMDHLEKLYEPDHSPYDRCVLRVSRTYYHGILEPESRRMHVPDPQLRDRRSSQATVSAIWKAVQWRTTTHRQHETLALATMFNMKTDDFADSINTTGKKGFGKGELDKRMKKFYNSLAADAPCPIPPGIIFLPGPHLDFKGYGWAPQTWLSNCTTESPDALALELPTARLNVPHGLEVSLPGFKLRHLDSNENPTTSLAAFSFPVDKALSQWYRVTSVDGDEVEELPNRDDDRDLAIITPRLLFKNLKEIALLVAVARTQGDVLFVQRLRRVWLSVEDDPKKRRQDFQANDFQSILCGERLSPEQIWCVDGRQDPEPRPPVGEPDEEGEPMEERWMLKNKTRTATAPLKQFIGSFTRRMTGL